MKNVVFLPGTLCDERIWKNQAPLCSSFEIVNLRTQNTLEKMLDTVYEVKFDSFLLVGFSMGGYVGQEFALRYAERVEHLFLLGSASVGYPEAEAELIRKSRPAIEKGLFKGITDRRLKEVLHPDSYADPEIRETIRSMAGADAAEVYLRQLDATFGRRNLKTELANLSCGLTALAGANDVMVPPGDILAFQDVLPSARVQVLDRCGHFIPLEKPAETNALLGELLQ